MGERDIWVPAPELTPTAVVDQVLTAFSEFSRSRAVKTAFNFAAPELRAAHEDLAGFDWYLSNPARLPLLEWSDHRRGPASVDETEASVTVFSYGPEDSQLFQFELTERSVGKYADCWLVTAINPADEQVPPDADETAYVEFEGERVACEYGDTLRDVLLDTPGMNPHNGLAGSVNCGGSGVCGTCAVEIEGRVSEPTGRESKRLSLPPHSGDDLRLACQTTVKGDVQVSKRGGFFGSDSHQQTYSEVTVTDSEYDGSHTYELLTDS